MATGVFGIVKKRVFDFFTHSQTVKNSIILITVGRVLYLINMDVDWE